MALPVFPTIKQPVCDFEEDYISSVISSEIDGGYKVTRPRFSRRPGLWVAKWETLNDTDYDKLMEFYKNTIAGGAAMFTWTHPKRNTVHTVRIAEKGKFNLNQYGWSGTLTIEEV